MKRIVKLLLYLALIMNISIITVYAASSGTCGENVTWTLDNAGLLTISGNDSGIESHPWNPSEVKQVKIEAGTTGITDYIFSDCSNLTSINVDANNPNYCSIDGVMFIKEKWKLDIFPAGRTGTYTVPSGVTVIENCAFCGCSKLTKIELPEGLTGIGHHAFSGCSSLTEITLPDSLKNIDDTAFDKTPLKIIYCSSGSYAANWAKKNGIPYGDISISESKDTQPAEVSYEIKVGETVRYDDNKALKGSLIDTVFIPASSDSKIASVTAGRMGNAIYANAVDYYFSVWVTGVSPGKAVISLYTDSSKTTVIWKKTVTIVDNSKSTSKTSSESTSKAKTRTVTAGNLKYKLSGSSATVIGPRKKSLKKLVIPASVKSGGKKYKVTAISANALKDMSKLTDLTIGANIEKIGKKACYNCRKLAKITIKTKKLKGKNVFTNAFGKIYKKALVKCPKGKKAAYRNIFIKKGMKKTAVFR